MSKIGIPIKEVTIDWTSCLKGYRYFSDQTPRRFL